MVKCEECGFELQDNEQVCPNCGCPREIVDAPASTDNEVLEKGKSNDAEAIITEVAETVLYWGNLASIVYPIFYIIQCLIGGAIQLDNNDAVGLFTIIGGFIFAVIYYFLIRLLAKIIWGVIMLFVNISSTLKRIELKLNENGTH